MLGKVITRMAPYSHPAALEPVELLKECTIARDRSRGPGGQHRNKVETAVFIEHNPTGISAQSTELRSQIKNKNRAVFRLRVRLALRHRRQVPIPGYKPSERLTERLRQQKKKLAVNPKHQDFPAILAEILDLVIGLNGDVKKASQYLNFLSSSQIIKFLKNEPEAFALLNEVRKKHGKHTLN